MKTEEVVMLWRKFWQNPFHAAITCVNIVLLLVGFCVAAHNLDEHPFRWPVFITYVYIVASTQALVFLNIVILCIRAFYSEPRQNKRVKQKEAELSAARACARLQEEIDALATR